MGNVPGEEQEIMPHQHHHTVAHQQQTAVLEPEIRYVQMPAAPPRQPSMLGIMMGSLLTGMVMFAVKVGLVILFLAALVVGCNKVVTNGLDHLPPPTTTTTAP